MERPVSRILWISMPVLLILAIYGKDLGHGFIKDDFAWIAGARIERPSDLLALLSTHNGFFRPLVSLTFALNEWLFDLNAFGYGLTNLLLVLACMGGICVLVRSLGMPWCYAWLASSVWGLNPHGVGGAILWISGRTALLLTLFAVLGAVAFLSGRWILAAFSLFLALLSKEEAVLLPAILAVWAGLSGEGNAPSRWRRAGKAAVLLTLPVAAYLALRMRTTAFLPWSAPSYYTPTFSPGPLARNVLEYADRSCTFAAAALAIVVVAVQRRPRPSPAETRWVLLGIVWLVGGFGLTVFLPLRSSLYACFPAVGSALAMAALTHSAVRQAPAQAAARVFPILALASIALLPVHRSRNVRMVRHAELSTRVLSAVKGHTADLAAGRVLVLHDDVDEKVNIASTFGTLVRDAVRLETGVVTAEVWVEPALPDSAALGLLPPGDRPAVHLRLRQERLVDEHQDPPGEP